MHTWHLPYVTYRSPTYLSIYLTRCVGKYIEAQNTVGGVLQQFEQKAKELAQAQMNASQARSDLGQRKF